MSILASFLDEIADLSLQAQADLLRVVQEGELRRLNSNIPEQVDIRIVAATNKNIYDLVRQEKFRYDLFMRLMQARLELPPLSERMEDFEELAAFFLRQKQEEYRKQGKPGDIQFDRNALLFLSERGQPWDGNIRALRNVVERAYETAAIEEYKNIDIGHVRRTLDILRKVKLPDDELEGSRMRGSETDEMSIEKIKEFLLTAVTKLDIQENTYDNLQSLEEHIKSCFFHRAINEFINRYQGKPPLNLRYAKVAEILGIDRKKLNNSQWMKEKVDECLTETFLPDSF
jgi:DNA-binding NtrC family response regulator